MGGFEITTSSRYAPVGDVRACIGHAISPLEGPAGPIESRRGVSNREGIERSAELFLWIILACNVAGPRYLQQLASPLAAQ
jgi:hypothetical protein